MMAEESPYIQPDEDPDARLPYVEPTVILMGSVADVTRGTGTGPGAPIAPPIRIYGSGRISAREAADIVNRSGSGDRD